MSALEGVERDLAGFPEDLANGTEANVARAMAQNIDSGRGSPSECAKALLQAIATLKELAPPKKEMDFVDQLAERRAERRAAVGVSEASPSKRS